MAVKYLIKTTETLRLECMSDVEDYHKWLQRDADKQGYQLVGFSWKEKCKRVKGEIADEWFVVSATKVFADEKDPDLPLRQVTYDMYEVELTNEIEPVSIELGEDY